MRTVILSLLAVATVVVAAAVFLLTFPALVTFVLLHRCLVVVFAADALFAPIVPTAASKHERLRDTNSKYLLESCIAQWVATVDTGLLVAACDSNHRRSVANDLRVVVAYDLGVAGVVEEGSNPTRFGFVRPSRGLVD